MPTVDWVVETKLSTHDIQRVIFVIVDGDFENDVLSFGVIALVAIRFDNDDPTQV